MSRQLVAVVLAVAAVAACAHGAPKKSESDVTDETARFTAWLGQLPRCPPSKVQAETPSFHRDEATDAVEARGLLTLSASPECTLMECLGSECCNACFPGWVVVPDGLEGPRELAIQKSGSQQ